MFPTCGILKCSQLATSENVPNLRQVEYGALVTKMNKYGETPLDKCQGQLSKRLQGKKIIFPSSQGANPTIVSYNANAAKNYNCSICLVLSYLISITCLPA
jgi:hypothetical protein